MATGKLFYLLGALYLFFINSLFICLSTFIIVRSLKFKKAQFATPRQQKRVVRSIWLIVLITILPSIYLAFRIVQKAIFEQNAKNFVQNEFRFPQTQVVNRTFRFDSKQPSIELLLIGQQLSGHILDSLRGRMHLYRLDSSGLVIRQGLDAKNEIDLAQIKASILEDVFSSNSKADTLKAELNKLELPIPDLKAELESLYPDMKEFTIGQTIIRSIDLARLDTVTLFVAKFPRYVTGSERIKMAGWLKERVRADSVKIILEREVP